MMERQEVRAVNVVGWELVERGKPLVRRERMEVAGPDEVIVRVAGCGVCHTDLGFAREGVPTRAPLPLTLGHEVSGVVVEAGPGAGAWQGCSVIVPAVLPCGACAACRAGRGSVCPQQVFPGSDVHGGFASHLRVPAHGLCRVPPLEGRADGLDLATLAVVADAVSTPYQAIERSGLAGGDLAVFVGAGGVGGFGAQIAAARGAVVVAVDIDEARLDLAVRLGAALAVDARRGFKEIRASVRRLAQERGVPSWRWKIFETSGSVEGQSTAFGLIGPGSYLSVVGYTPKAVELKFSNLMAFDATVQGNWGCVPELYPAALELVLSGQVRLGPVTEKRPMEGIDEVFGELAAHGARRRVVLVP